MAEAKPKRPTGILILAVVVLIAGLFLLTSGITTLLNTGAGTLDFWLRGIGYVVLGALVAIAGLALLRRRRWAWNLAFVAVLIAFGYALYQTFFGPGLTVLGGLVLTFEIVALGYLVVVRKHFRRVIVTRA